MGDTGLIPGSESSPGEGNGTPLQYSCLGNPVDRGAWRAAVHGVAKSQTRLSYFTFTFIVSLFSAILVGLGASQVARWLRICLLVQEMSSIPRSRRCLGGENGNPLQYSCLGNPVDRGAWRAAVQGVTESRTELSAHTHPQGLSAWSPSPGQRLPVSC